MNRNDAIQWCEESLPKWPTGAMTLHVLARPEGWTWKQSGTVNKHTVYLSDGVDIISRITKSDIPKFSPPKLVSLEVIQFLDLAIDVKKRELKDRILTTTQETFKKLCEELPEIKSHADIHMTESVYEGVKIIVLHDDINIISGFLSTYDRLFCEFLANKERGDDFDSIIKTLFNSKQS